ncbi:MAG: hypothetical protein AAFP76_04940 [Bacteroidota bacterium]
MKVVLKRLIQLALLVTMVWLLYASYSENHGRVLELYFFLYFFALTYHLVHDKSKSRLYMVVLSLFVVSGIIGVLYFHEKARPRPFAYVYALNFVSFLGYLLIFLKMYKENRPYFVINWRSIIIAGILALNIFFGYKIVALVQKYNLSLDHFFFGIAYTIFKMIFMSAGMIFYLTSRRKSRKISLLNGSFISFFLGDIVDTLNSLVFIRDPIPASGIIHSGLLGIGLFFFYMYCTSPEIDQNLEKEGYI